MSADVFYHTGVTGGSVSVLVDSGTDLIPMLSTDRYDWKHIQLSVSLIGLSLRFQQNGLISIPYVIGTAGRYAIYQGELIRISGMSQAENSRPVLLITDLDETLISREEEGQTAMRRFFGFWIAYHLFNGSKLVYCTGRSFPRFSNVFREHPDILHADCVITGIGGEAFTLDLSTGQHIPLEDFYDGVDTHNWDSEIVSKMLVTHYPFVRRKAGLGEDTRLSVLREIDEKDAEMHFGEIKRYMENREGRVTDGKVVKVRALLSGVGNTRYLDFIPIAGGKRTGVSFAMKKYGFPPDRTFTAGDSANDISMLQGPEPGVIPANAQTELIAWYHAHGARYNKYISQFSYADSLIELLSRS